ncbi:MAG: spermidine/putrescine ABC transporter substrate-binding protein [Chloroflexi bacterium]|nr:spermidine/putrescine ABC transporter substrate-binding protein [Chloroflexota bacterium]
MIKLFQLNSYVRGCLSACLILGFLNSSCAQAPTQPPLADEIVVYNWDGDIPQSALDAFTEETHVKIKYEAYESQEEAIANIRAGKIYDVVVMESRFIPLMVKDNLLAELNYENIPNFKNISPNFRDLIYDPGNLYSIPYSWGTTGMVVRTDLAQNPVSRWADLWDAKYAGKVGIWVGQPRETLALTLKSLGYSANSEKPAELEEALTALIALKPNLHFIEDFDPESAAPALSTGKIVIAMGYSGDFLASKDIGLQVEYIMPEEGALLWGDTFVIPSNSPNQSSAELFINFILRPEISAEIVNQKYYASANDAARIFIDPQISGDPSIYPGEETLRKAEIILPLSVEGQTLYDDIWQRFLDADPK